MTSYNTNASTGPNRSSQALRSEIISWMIDGSWWNCVLQQDIQFNLAMPHLASNDQGPTPACSLWPCLAVQVMTEGKHLQTQSGHALLCKQRLSTIDGTWQFNLAIFFWWCFTRRGLTNLYLLQHLDCCHHDFQGNTDWWITSYDTNVSTGPNG